MNIRVATISDLEDIVKIERACFPVEEACTEESFRKRLEVYPNHFWLLESEDKLIGFINGMLTDSLTIADEMFEKSELHNENGAWQAIFGVCVMPEYRNRAYAESIMKRVISDTREQNRKGLILTCKEKLINYYAKFGFKNYGVSASTHGGEVWYDMRLEF